MLKNLLVKDYALIEEINIEFGRGLNIITGETGAGKSILIDAMSLLLGERASTDVIRKGAQKAVVEGVFEVGGNSKVASLLEENDIEQSEEMIIRREISLKGSNRCFVNDTPVQLYLIKELGNLLVDLHGQHEHQSLLRSDTHIEFLDQYCNNYELLAEFTGLKKQLKEVSLHLKELKEKEFSLKEKKEIYSYQIKEIDAVAPQEGEEETITEQLNILENSEKLLELTNDLYESLYNSENSLRDSLVNSLKKIELLADIDKTFGESLNEAQSALSIINDISEFLRKYNSRINLDQSELNNLRDRLGAVNLLKKKYGGSIKSVLEYRKKIGEEFESAENFADNILKLEKQIEQLRSECGKAAAILSSKRKKAAGAVAKEIVNTLKELGIQEPAFKVNIENHPSDDDSQDFLLIDGKKYLFDKHGYDSAEFFISTNAGEDLKPLVKVASGGEVSRIMLALKSILAKSDKLPLLIFDEIDTGVSGRIARKVGLTMKSLASSHQLIAITHLPQISALADHHYTISKENINGRVTSLIKKLTSEERVKEVARLLSGENVTDAALTGAKELLKR